MICKKVVINNGITQSDDIHLLPANEDETIFTVDTKSLEQKIRQRK